MIEPLHTRRLIVNDPYNPVRLTSAKSSTLFNLANRLFVRAESFLRVRHLKNKFDEKSRIKYLSCSRKSYGVFHSVNNSLRSLYNFSNTRIRSALREHSLSD